MTGCARSVQRSRLLWTVTAERGGESANAPSGLVGQCGDGADVNTRRAGAPGGLRARSGRGPGLPLQPRLLAAPWDRGTRRRGGAARQRGGGRGGAGLVLRTRRADRPTRRRHRPRRAARWRSRAAWCARWSGCAASASCEPALWRMFPEAGVSTSARAAPGPRERPLLRSRSRRGRAVADRRQRGHQRGRPARAEVRRDRLVGEPAWRWCWRPGSWWTLGGWARKDVAGYDLREPVDRLGGHARA